MIHICTSTSASQKNENKYTEQWVNTCVCVCVCVERERVTANIVHGAIYRPLNVRQESALLELLSGPEAVPPVPLAGR